MAHFIYPSGTPIGNVPFGYVVPSGEWQTTIRQVFKAINGDEGGTWAPSSFITIGGSGIKLTGVGHQIASGGRFNVMSGGEVRVQNGGLLRVDGSSGDILIQVDTNVAKMTFESNSFAQWNAGAALDMYGSLSFKTSGAGSATWEDGTTGTWQSGSFLNLNSGAVMNANGQIKVYGQILVMSTGSISFISGSTLVVPSGASIACGGQLGVTGDFILAGSNNWVQLSPDRAITRVIYDLIPLSYNSADAGAILSPHVYWFPSPATIAPAATTTTSLTSGNKSVLRMLNLPVGAVIESIDITSHGLIEAGSGLQLATFQLVSWADSIASGYSTHSLPVDDGHTTMNFLSAAVTVTVTASGGGVTVQQGRQYGILFTHPYNTSGILGPAIAISEVNMTLSTDIMRV